MTAEELVERIGRSLLYVGPELLIWCTAALLSLVLLYRKPAVPGLMVLAALLRVVSFVLSQSTSIAASATLANSGDWDTYMQVAMVRGAVTNAIYALLLLLVVVAAFGWRSEAEPEMPKA